MREKFPHLYESSDETIRAAQRRAAEPLEDEPKPRTRHPSKRKIGSKAVRTTMANPELTQTAYEILRQTSPDGRVDYGRILRDEDGSVTVYNNRAQRNEFAAKRQKKPRRRS